MRGPPPQLQPAVHATAAATAAISLKRRPALVLDIDDLVDSSQHSNRKAPLESKGLYSKHVRKGTRGDLCASPMLCAPGDAIEKVSQLPTLRPWRRRKNFARTRQRFCRPSLVSMIWRRASDQGIILPLPESISWRRRVISASQTCSPSSSISVSRLSSIAANERE